MYNLSRWHDSGFDDNNNESAGFKVYLYFSSASFNLRK